jgi:hypothetical protein
MSSVYRVIKGYGESSDTTAYHDDESDITEYREAFYRELSRRMFTAQHREYKAT